jgi:hypothetical protein
MLEVTPMARANKRFRFNRIQGAVGTLLQLRIVASTRLDTLGHSVLTRLDQQEPQGSLRCYQRA